MFEKKHERLRYIESNGTYVMRPELIEEALVTEMGSRYLVSVTAFWLGGAVPGLVGASDAVVDLELFTVRVDAAVEV